MTASQETIILMFLFFKPRSERIKVPLLESKKADEIITVVTLNISDGAGPSEDGVNIK